MIRLEVIGTPQPQGNKSAFHNAKTGKTVLVEGRRPASRAAFKSWREGIANEAKAYQAEHRLALIDEPVSVVVTFRMPRPKSTPKKVTRPAVRPDLDKLQRAVLDALEGTLLMNDSRVVDLVARKVFAVEEPPGCVIEIAVADADPVEVA